MSLLCCTGSGKDNETPPIHDEVGNLVSESMVTDDNNQYQYNYWTNDADGQSWVSSTQNTDASFGMLSQNDIDIDDFLGGPGTNGLQTQSEYFHPVFTATGATGNEVANVGVGDAIDTFYANVHTNISGDGSVMDDTSYATQSSGPIANNSNVDTSHMVSNVVVPTSSHGNDACVASSGAGVAGHKVILPPRGDTEDVPVQATSYSRDVRRNQVLRPVRNPRSITKPTTVFTHRNTRQKLDVDFIRITVRAYGHYPVRGKNGTVVGSGREVPLGILQEAKIFMDEDSPARCANCEKCHRCYFPLAANMNMSPGVFFPPLKSSTPGASVRNVAKST